MNKTPKWTQEQEAIALQMFQDELEYLFGLSHYDWMYRVTGDENYLKEKLNYIRRKCVHNECRPV